MIYIAADKNGEVNLFSSLPVKSDASWIEVFGSKKIPFTNNNPILIYSITGKTRISFNDGCFIVPDFIEREFFNGIF